MFAIINTNGANHIAIHIPHQGAERSLPALAAMLEQNATFIQQGYQEMKTVKPTMSISLGDTHMLENYGVELALVIPGADSVLDESFTIAAPEVFTSNAKGIRAKEEELSKLRTELQFVKQQLEGAKGRVEQLETRFASELAPF